jgi:hypothetical protein
MGFFVCFGIIKDAFVIISGFRITTVLQLNPSLAA